MKLKKRKMEILMAERLMDPLRLCNKAGISLPTYKRALTQNVKLSTVGKIAKALEVSPAEIMKEEV